LRRKQKGAENVKTFSAPFLLLDSIKFQGAPQGIYVGEGVVAAEADADGAAFGGVQGTVGKWGAMQARTHANSLIGKVLSNSDGRETAMIEK
jgi:hypothetical protein